MKVKVTVEAGLELCQAINACSTAFRCSEVEKSLELMTTVTVVPGGHEAPLVRARGGAISHSGLSAIENLLKQKKNTKVEKRNIANEVREVFMRSPPSDLSDS